MEQILLEPSSRQEEGESGWDLPAQVYQWQILCSLPNFSDVTSTVEAEVDFDFSKVLVTIFHTSHQIGEISEYEK